MWRFFECTCIDANRNAWNTCPCSFNSLPMDWPNSRLTKPRKEETLGRNPANILKSNRLKTGWSQHSESAFKVCDFCCCTVEPRFVDTLPLWTPYPRGHFLPGLFVFLVLPVPTPSFTSVDTSLLWTLFVRPSGVHIGEVLLYYTLPKCWRYIKASLGELVPLEILGKPSMVITPRDI